MFNFYQAAERRAKEKAAEAKRLQDIQDETNTTAWPLYQALSDYIAKNNFPANVMQYHRTINIVKNDGSSMDIEVSEGPTFVRQLGGSTGSHSSPDDVVGGEPTRSVREVEDAIVDWLGTP
ncbi:hypothetical protein [Methylobacterium sp. NFXW15]|uniref:hypothetical protein n=1 Tax=Methylobacterium sp. NFXW15 TaxID=2819512 RepID=UPI003CF7191B